MDSSTRVDILEAWHAAAPRWERLHAQGFATPFQHPHWLATWYGVFGARRGVEPMIVAVSDAAGNDIMLLPLIRRTGKGLRVIEFADRWATDYNAPLIGAAAPTDPAGAEALWQSVLAALPAADKIQLTKMPIEIQGRPNPLALLRRCRASETSGFIVDLPDNYEDYRRSLKKDVENLLRRRWNRLVKDTGAELRWIDDAEEGRRVLGILDQQQKARLNSLGARHVFDEADYRELYERHVTQGLASGGAVLTAIVAGDEVVATFLGVTDGRCCTLVRSSQIWTGDWTRYGLGKLIIDRSVRALHERGYRQFDLSIGDLAYKHDFGVRRVPMVDLNAVRSWRAVPSACRDFALSRLKKTRFAVKLGRPARRILSIARQRRVPASAT